MPKRVTTRFLIVGFIAFMLLAIPTVGIPWLAVTRSEHRALRIAEDSQQTTFYLGDLGQELARLRVNAANPDPEDLASIVRDLQTAIDNVGRSLDPVAAFSWGALQPPLESLIELYIAGRFAPGIEAKQRTEEPAMAGQVFDGINALAHVHQLRVRNAIRQAHEDAVVYGRLGFLFFSLFAVGVVAIWSEMLRVLNRQRQQLEEHTSRLEAANADLDAFAGRVAHDLRNAIGPLVMAPSLLRDTAEPAMVRRVADHLERAARQALTVVDALLAFSRASGEVEPDEAGSLRVAVRSVLDELGPAIAGVDATVDVPELPDVSVRCNPGLLHMVLANICGNAVKYLAGQEQRRVYIAAGVEGVCCWIDVRDTGPGIPKEAQARLFEPFYRVPGTRAPGTGIGLATARRIVLARGGRIELESAPGQGSRFRIWLPVAVSAGPAPAPEPELSASGPRVTDPRRADLGPRAEASSARSRT